MSIQVGDLVRFAHLEEPAGHVTKVVRFMGQDLVEIEGWAGQFGQSGLVIVRQSVTRPSKAKPGWMCDDDQLIREG